MSTINADAHALMKRIHKADPNMGTTEQDQRSFIPIEAGDGALGSPARWTKHRPCCARRPSRCSPQAQPSSEEPTMAHKILAIDDPAGLLLDDLRQRALASADAVLEHYGMTVKDCAAVGTRLFKKLAPGDVHNFFNGTGRAATTWLELALSRRTYAGRTCCGSSWTSRRRCRTDAEDRARAKRAEKGGCQLECLTTQ